MPKWVWQPSARSHQREENFSSTPRTSCLLSRNHLFLGSGCQNESNSHQLARIGEKKIYHELDVHHVYTVRITCFWNQDAKVSLTANTPLESARRKFSWTRRTSCLQSKNHLFLASGSQNVSRVLMFYITYCLEGLLFLFHSSCGNRTWRPHCHNVRYLKKCVNIIDNMVIWGMHAKIVWTQLN